MLNLIIPNRITRKDTHHFTIIAIQLTSCESGHVQPTAAASLACVENCGPAQIVHGALVDLPSLEHQEITRDTAFLPHHVQRGH